MCNCATAIADCMPCGVLIPPHPVAPGASGRHYPYCLDLANMIIEALCMNTSGLYSSWLKFYGGKTLTRSAFPVVSVAPPWANLTQPGTLVVYLVQMSYLTVKPACSTAVVVAAVTTGALRKAG